MIYQSLFMSKSINKNCEFSIEKFELIFSLDFSKKLANRFESRVFDSDLLQALNQNWGLCSFM